MTDPSTPVPGDEAVEAAILAASNPVHDDGHTDNYYAGLLAAAYAIDAPRFRAEAAAEARAATLREVEAWLREAGTGWPEHELELVADDLAAHFNPEAMR